MALSDAPVAEAQGNLPPQQVPVVLVSNIDEAQRSTQTVSYGTVLWQSFTVPRHGISSASFEDLGLRLNADTDKLDVELWSSNQNGSKLNENPADAVPKKKLADLAKGTYNLGSVTYGDDENISLSGHETFFRAGATFFVRLAKTDNTGSDPRVVVTASDNQTGASLGWLIGDNVLRSQGSGYAVAWSESLRLEVYGQQTAADQSLQATPGNGRVVLSWGPTLWNNAEDDVVVVEYKHSHHSGYTRLGFVDGEAECVSNHQGWCPTTGRVQHVVHKVVPDRLQAYGRWPSQWGWRFYWRDVSQDWCTRNGGCRTVPGETLVNGVSHDFRIRPAASTSEADWRYQSGLTPTPEPRSSLAAPQNLRAVPGDDQVVLTWDAVTGAASYLLTFGAVGFPLEEATGYPVRWSLFDDQFMPIAGTATTYTITSTNLPPAAGPTAENDHRFVYRLAAVDSQGRPGGESAEVTATPGDPAAPSIPWVQVVENPGQLIVSWSDVGANADYYQINWKTDTGSNECANLRDWDHADNTPTNVYRTHYTLRGEARTTIRPIEIDDLTNGTEYCLAVRGVNGSLGGDTRFFDATPRLAPRRPTLNSATPGLRMVTLSWTSPPSEAQYHATTGYSVGYRVSGVGAAFERYAVVPAAVTQMEVGPLVAGTAYDFEVIGLTAGALTSAPSDSLTATPSGPADLQVTAVNVVHNGTSLTVTWTAPQGAAGYDITYRRDGDPWARAAWNRPAADGTTITITCDSRHPGHTVNCVQPGGTYTVGIRVRTTDSEGPWHNTTN